MRGWFWLAAAGSGGDEMGDEGKMVGRWCGGSGDGDDSGGERCPMCVVIDGEVWGGQRRLMVRGWLREGGVEVAAMVMLVTYGGEEGDDGVVVRGDGVRWRDHVENDPRMSRMEQRSKETRHQCGRQAEQLIGRWTESSMIKRMELEVGEPQGGVFRQDTKTDGLCLEVSISMIERIDSLRLENLKVRAMLDIERDRVNSLRLHMSLSQEEFCQVRRDRDDTRGRLRRLESYVERRLEARRVNRDLELGNGNDNGGGDGNGNGNGNGTGNGNNGGDNGDGNENRNVNGRGDRPVARECTYQDFMKCQPLSFKGTEGVVGLIRWSEKMETVFHISNCPERYQVKYATCTLLDSALTWWNSHKRTIRTDAAYALSWRELLKLMTEVYCPRNEIQKMETELWNLSVKNNDMATYTQRFQELTMMCTKMVPEEEDRVEKFIGGLPDNI
ncbi:putative reverse transcriptase domain-containing protein [Tanacetum coccineum]